MCGCSTHQTTLSGRTAAVEHEPGTLTVRVDDMVCGHCAETITKAIETALPGTNVDADFQSKIVRVRGPADLAAVQGLIAQAGYAAAPA